MSHKLPEGSFLPAAPAVPGSTPAPPVVSRPRPALAITRAAPGSRSSPLLVALLTVVVLILRPIVLHAILYYCFVVAPLGFRLIVVIAIGHVYSMGLVLTGCEAEHTSVTQQKVWAWCMGKRHFTIYSHVRIYEKNMPDQPRYPNVLM